MIDPAVGVTTTAAAGGGIILLIADITLPDLWLATLIKQLV